MHLCRDPTKRGKEREKKREGRTEEAGKSTNASPFSRDCLRERGADERGGRGKKEGKREKPHESFPLITSTPLNCSFRDCGPSQGRWGEKKKRGKKGFIFSSPPINCAGLDLVISGDKNEGRRRRKGKRKEEKKKKRGVFSMSASSLFTPSYSIGAR